jgi:tRNA(Ile)-lysidine synthase
LSVLDQGALFERFDRLAQQFDGPISVAVSGGGDSICLAHLLACWKRKSGRDVCGLIVDHGLQPGSQAIAAAAAEQVEAMGLPAQVLRWKSPQLSSGLQAAARAARHRLLAQAARDLGSRVILMAQTADDQAETLLHRLARDSGPIGLAGMAELTVSPQWPHAPGTMIARPLLAVRRQALRDWLSMQAINWHDDPANLDERFARVRIRRLLALPGMAGAHERLLGVAGHAGKLRKAMIDWQRDWLIKSAKIAGSYLEFDARWHDLPTELQVRMLGLAIAGVAGMHEPVSSRKIATLIAKLPAGGATLAGVKVRSDSNGLTIAPAPPRKIGSRGACNKAGAALHLPLTLRLAHLVGDINSVIASDRIAGYDKQPSTEANTAIHDFVPQAGGMVSAE